jgi:hypothetical protein
MTVPRGYGEGMTTDAHTPLTARNDRWESSDGTDVHLLIEVTRGADGLHTMRRMGQPASWANCQLRWEAADAERRAAGIPMHTTYYMVRSISDPKVASVAPRRYVSVQAAAHALARRTGLSRWRLLEQLCPGVRTGGWWAIAQELRKGGYIGTLADGSAYLTGKENR